MKHQVLKKAFLASVLSMLGFGSWAQMSHNTLFFGFSPAGNMTYLVNPFSDTTSTAIVPLTYKVIDGFTFSKYMDYNKSNRKDQFSFVDLRLSYLHGRNAYYSSYADTLGANLEDPATQFGNDFRQLYLQTNFGYIVNNKHRVQFPLYIGILGGYAWTQEFGSIMFGMGLGAKIHVYVTDQIGLFAGGHLVGAFGMYDITCNAYYDFGLSYSIVNN